MIDTYIINLKEEIQNYYNVKNLLLKKNFKNIYRFNAIYGKKIDNLDYYDKYLHKLFKYFGPYGAIGSALSHYILLESIYDNALKQDDNKLLNNYVLILEDDVIPIFNYKKLKTIVRNIPTDCDILILHSFEQLLFYKNKINKKYILKNKLMLASPCCSYLIKINSIPLFITKKLWTYFDLVHFNTNFLNATNSNIYVYKKQIFNTNYNVSHNLKHNNIYNCINTILHYYKIPNLFFFTLFKILRIPFLNYEFNLIEIIFILILYKICKLYINN